MIAAIKAWIARGWPVVRLRTILLATMLFVAALPGFGAIFLRVYENALVRRTEAELLAQGAALAAAAGIVASESLATRIPLQAAPPLPKPPERYYDQVTEVDLLIARPSATSACRNDAPSA